MHLAWAAEWFEYMTELQANLTRPALVVPVFNHQVCTDEADGLGGYPSAACGGRNQRVCVLFRAMYDEALSGTGSEFTTYRSRVRAELPTRHLLRKNRLEGRSLGNTSLPEQLDSWFIAHMHFV